jgi:predicted TIM-barrel fold metal-dependent hydrolase
MLIVDSQIHLWGSGKPNGVHRQVSSFTAAEALKDMEAAGVDAAIVHPPGWDPGAQDVALAAAKAHPDRFAVLGRFALEKPESRGLVDGWKKQPGMLGLRFTFLADHQKSWLSDGTMDWLWPAAERDGIPVGLAAAHALPAVAKIADRHPRLKLIIDHLAAVGGKKDAEAYAALPDLVALAKFPNVVVKASAAPGTSSEPYPYKNVHGYLQRIYDAFGPKRYFWGTDITRMPCSWRQCVTMFTEELAFLKGPDLELVMGRGFCDFLGWKR